jgi:hypothetical protein
MTLLFLLTPVMHISLMSLTPVNAHFAGISSEAPELYIKKLIVYTKKIQNRF